MRPWFSSILASKHDSIPRLVLACIAGFCVFRQSKVLEAYLKRLTGTTMTFAVVRVLEISGYIRKLIQIPMSARKHIAQQQCLIFFLY